MWLQQSEQEGRAVGEAAGEVGRAQITEAPARGLALSQTGIITKTTLDLLSMFCVPSTVLRAFNPHIESSHQIGTNYPRFRDEESEANKGYITCARIHC